MRKSLLLFIIFIVLTSCSNMNADTHQEVGVLYTSATIPDSAFVTLDAKGQTISQTDLLAVGMFQVAKGDNGSLLFPVRYTNQLYTLQTNEKWIKSKILSYPLFIKENKDFRVTTYNSNLNSGTVEWKQAKQMNQITLDGFPRVATFDQSHIFVFSSIIRKKKAVLYIISRSTKKLEKTIPLAIDQANDIQIIDHTLWFTSTANQNKIGLLNLTTWKVDYLTVPEKQPEYLLLYANKLIITYQGSSSLTILNRKTLHLEEQVTLPQPVLKAKQKGNQLFILSRIPGNDQGVIGVYQLDTWKLHHKILLPKVRNTLVQDFMVY